MRFVICDIEKGRFVLANVQLVHHLEIVFPCTYSGRLAHARHEHESDVLVTDVGDPHLESVFVASMAD